MRFARLENGVAVEFVEAADADAIAEMFHPSLTFVAAPPGATIGWVFDGTDLTQPPPPAPTKAELVAYTANKRWQVETGGIIVAGVPVATDDRSKIMIIGARVKADADANFTTQWKAASGDFITIDAATIIAISDAVLAHVDACFAAEAVVLAGIEGGTVTTTAEIDAADWP